MEGILRHEVPVEIQDENVELRMKDVGDMTVAFVRLRKGTDLAPAFAGLPDGRCPCPHWGYMLRGRLMMRTAQGDETYEAGQAFYWTAGHVPVPLEDCEYVDFSPKGDFHAVIAHLKRVMQAGQPKRPGAPAGIR